MPATDTAPSLTEVATERLEWSRNLLNALVEPLSDEQMLYRPGGRGNHALWVMGHIAVTDDMILRELAGKPVLLDERFAAMFQGGSTPCDDASFYPSRAAVRTALAETRASLLSWVRSLSEPDLRRRTPEWLAPFAPDFATMPFSAVAHELFHAGQVATVRASLGLKPVMG